MIPLSQFSRFHATRVITESDGTERFGIWKQPRNINVGERIYVVKGDDLDRPDLISFKMYGRVDLWWLVMWYNSILDPFSIEVGDRLRIPDFQDIIPRTEDIDLPIVETVVEAAPPIIRPFTTPPFQGLQEVDTTVPTVTTDTAYEFNYGFIIPDLQSTSVHFILEISLSDQFTSVVLSKSTVNSTEKWSYYNPFANSGEGGHAAFPRGGISASALKGNTVYYRLTNEDGLVPGKLYYVRHRAVVDGVALVWNSPPPFVMRHN